MTSEPAEELLRTAVRGDEDAIGFVHVRQTSGVNDVDYEGIPCTSSEARAVIESNWIAIA